MACTQNVITTTTNNNNINTVAGLLRRIEHMQKDALTANANALCETCLMGAMYNTKPISIYVRGELFFANVGLTDETTRYFRVEEVRGNDTVVLRLLVLEDGVLTCTNTTIVVCINCICSIQCFDPINCNFANCSCMVEA